MDLEGSSPGFFSIGMCVRLTTLPTSYAGCLDILEASTP